MNTKIFHPNITQEAIQQALQTPVEAAYPEPVLTEKIRMEKSELRNRIIGMLVLTPLALLFGIVLIINVFNPGFFAIRDIGDRIICGIFFLIFDVSLIAIIPSSKKWNQSLRKVVQHFYSDLCVNVKPNYLKNYFILDANIMKHTSKENFQKIWEDLEQGIQAEVRDQETATCTQCGESSRGIWAADKYWFKDYFLESTKLFLRCSKCEAVYCSKCYVKLLNRHACPKCEKKMKEIAPRILREGMATFIPEPTLFKTAQISNLQFTNQSEQTSDVLCDVTYVFNYEDVIEPQSGSNKRQIALGDRGTLICQFHNKAVKIGEEWRLLAAHPGNEQPA